MVKKTVQTYECDICGREAERYTITFPEGLKALDRCDLHNSKILAFRDEKGSWVSAGGPRKAMFKVSSPEDIKRQLME